MFDCQVEALLIVLLWHKQFHILIFEVFDDLRRGHENIKKWGKPGT